MATRQAEALALVARVRRVGWPVEQIDGGVWKVTCPNRKRVQIHQTPSDRNSSAGVLRALNASGFAEAEAEVAAAAEAAKEAKLAAAKARNDAATKRATARATRLSRAAGPYGPSEVTLADLLAKHPAPAVYHRVLITPDMATAMLARNTKNRKPNKADIAEWTKVLRGGRWRYTHQGVAFDVDGRLQDGQHRLSAIVEAGIAAEMLVAVGMPPDNFSVIDTGRRRSAAQVLAMDGAVYASWMATATRHLYLYEVWGSALLDHVYERVGNDLILDAYAKLDGDTFVEACRNGQRLRREIGVAPTGVAAALYLIGQAVGPGNSPSRRSWRWSSRPGTPGFAGQRGISHLAVRAGAQMPKPAVPD